MTSEQAESIAISVLSWMATQTEILEGFLGTTGASPDEIRSQAGDPMFLGFVLDYVLSQDNFVMDYAEMTNSDPHDLAIARQALPGGAVPNWT